MRADQPRPGPKLNEQGGFTLPEMMLATTIFLIVATAAMALLMASFRQTNDQSSRIVALDDARNGLMKMTNEIRSAVRLESLSSQVLDVLVHVPGDTVNPYHWIRFKCVGNNQGASQGLGGTCSRQDKTINSGQPDCTVEASGPGCTLILRNVTKHGSDHFGEPCENYDPASNEEKHFCVKQNRTVQLSIFTLIPGARNPLELRTATTIRNCMTNQGTVVPCASST